MNRIDTELDQFSQWPTAQRFAAFQQLVPRGVLQKALAQSTRPTHFCRRLPGWFLLAFVVGLGLCCRDSYRHVSKWLQPFRPRGTPGRSTLCMARQRLGIAPVRWLAEHVARLLATPTTPGTFHRGYRLMGLDGFILDVPDTPANDRAFGRPKSGKGQGAFPQVRVLSLCELGTHLLGRNLIKPICRGEVSRAPALLRHLQSDMVLVGDRNFFGDASIRQVVVDREAQLLARVKTNLIFRKNRQWDDGSYLSKVCRTHRGREKDRNGIDVRILEYVLTDPNRPGYQQKHRLLTTLLDAKLDPAVAVVECTTSVGRKKSRSTN